MGDEFWVTEVLSRDCKIEPGSGWHRWKGRGGPGRRTGRRYALELKGHVSVWERDGAGLCLVRNQNPDVAIDKRHEGSVRYKCGNRVIRVTP